VFEALACADSVLQTDERELGVCLVDIGAGSTDLIVYYEGVVITPERFRLVATISLTTWSWFPHTIPDAETSRRCLAASLSRAFRRQRDRGPSVGDRPSRLMQQRLLARYWSRVRAS